MFNAIFSIFRNNSYFNKSFIDCKPFFNNDPFKNFPLANVGLLRDPSIGNMNNMSSQSNSSTKFPENFHSNFNSPFGQTSSQQTSYSSESSKRKNKRKNKKKKRNKK